MTLRPTQASTYELVRHGLELNFSKLARAQEQVASGKRILRPSDDAIGTSIGLSLRRQAGNVQTFKGALDSSKPILEATAAALQEASNLLSEARAFTLQGINGTLDQENRESIANQMELLRQQLIETANSRSGDRYLFSGTATDRAPFSERGGEDTTRVAYDGNGEQQQMLIGRGVRISINLPGDEIFAQFEASGVSYNGVTGAAAGTSADTGTGFHELVVRHDSTSGLGAGLVSSGGGASDTIVGDHLLSVNASAGTVRLGTGEVLALPAPTDQDYGDFVVRDADGSELHLDFSGWTGTDFSGTVSGSASIALDGEAFVSLDLSQADFEIASADGTTVLHVDATGITRSGAELVSFQGAANIFDTLQGIADDLRAGEELGGEELAARLGQRLNELDRNATNVLAALGQIGARMERAETTQQRLDEVDLHLKGLISETEDVDLSSVVLDLNRAEMTLQVAQATGARLLQQTLLNYLR